MFLDILAIVLGLATAIYTLIFFVVLTDDLITGPWRYRRHRRKLMQEIRRGR